MKSALLLTALLAVIAPASAADSGDAPGLVADAHRARVSYAFGLNLGHSWCRIDFDLAAVSQGLNAGLTHEHLRYTEKELTAAFAAFTQSSGRDGTAASASRTPASYALGLNLAAQWQAGGMDLDPAQTLSGLKDAKAGRAAAMTDAEATALLSQYGRELMAQQQQRRALLAEENQQKASDFLTHNRSAPDVVCLPGGLQYRVLASAHGPAPTLANWVRLKYRCARIDGTVVASSADHPEAAVFAMGSVIRGWADALQQMAPGAKWRLFVPPELAYGSDGAPRIAPNELLIYDLELVSVLDSQPQPTAEDLRNERGPDGD